MKIYNTLFIGYPDGIFIDGTTTEANATANEIQIRNCIVAGCTSPLKSTNSSFGVTAWYNTSGYGNSVLTNSSDVVLTNAFSLTAPNFLPGGGSPAASGASFSGLSSGFETVSYIGAFGTTDWTTGWANFDPQNLEY